MIKKTAKSEIPLKQTTGGFGNRKTEVLIAASLLATQIK